MASRVYWKTLILVLNGVKSYIQRNQNNLFLNLTTPQYNCVLAVLSAVIECLQALPTNTPEV
jgi:hypothetical protein